MRQCLALALTLSCGASPPTPSPASAPATAVSGGEQAAPPPGDDQTPLSADTVQIGDEKTIYPHIEEYHLASERTANP